MNVQARVAISLFGKLSSTSDFVRIHHDSPDAMELDAWLNGAVQELHIVGGRWPESALRFLYLTRRGALTGVLRDSRDRAGRKFPLAVYRPLERPTSFGAIAASVWASNSFHDEVEAGLDTLRSSTRDEALLHLGTIDGSVDATNGAIALDEALAARPAAEFEHALFRGDGSSLAKDAYDSTCQAAQRVRTREASSTLAVDFPIRSAQDAGAWVWLWMKLVSDLPSGIFWSPEGGRVVVVHGALPATLPVWFSAPNKQRGKRIEVGVRYPARTGELDDSEVSPFDGDQTSLRARFEQTIDAFHS
jgi:type VI secretion system protein ImpM